MKTILVFAAIIGFVASSYADGSIGWSDVCIRLTKDCDDSKYEWAGFVQTDKRDEADFSIRFMLIFSNYVSHVQHAYFKRDTQLLGPWEAPKGTGKGIGMGTRACGRLSSYYVSFTSSAGDDGVSIRFSASVRDNDKKEVIARISKQIIVPWNSLHEEGKENGFEYLVDLNWH